MVQLFRERLPRLTPCVVVSDGENLAIIVNSHYGGRQDVTPMYEHVNAALAALTTSHPAGGLVS